MWYNVLKIERGDNMKIQKLFSPNTSLLDAKIGKVSLYARRGGIINTDPQRRCYNGCHFSSRVEWSEWEYWMNYPSEDHAITAKRIFEREDLQFKIVIRG